MWDQGSKEWDQGSEGRDGRDLGLQPRDEGSQAIGSRISGFLRDQESGCIVFVGSGTKIYHAFRGVARIFSEERTIFQIASEQLPPPPPSPFKTVATQGHSQTEFYDRRGMVCPLRRRELLGG